MMSFGAKPGTASILIPDHTHWGNEGPLLGKVTTGLGIQGWDNQYQHLKVISCAFQSLTVGTQGLGATVDCGTAVSSVQNSGRGKKFCG